MNIIKDNSSVEENNTKPNGSTGTKKIEEITSVIDFIKWVGTLKGRVILYRGQSCSNWGITTSASRLLNKSTNLNNDKNNNITIKDEERILREISHNINLIDHYRIQDLHKSQSSEIAKTNLGVLAQLQHDGSATSLIDFTSNPLVALWFACQKWPDGKEAESKEEGRGGRVFAIYVDQSGEFEEIDSVDKLNINIGDVIRGNKSIYWKPAHINNRIIAQGSFFVMGGKVQEASKIFIPDDYKENILEELHQRYNIKELYLFPDSSGFAKANSLKSEYSTTTLDLYEEARNLHDEELYEAEMEIYQGIIEKDNYPENKKGYAYHLKALVLFGLGKFKDAIDNYNSAIKCNPEDYAAYVNLGLAICEQGNYDDAIKIYNRVIDDLEYKSWRVYSNRGIAKFEKGNIYGRMEKLEEAFISYDESIKDYDEALKINPYSSEVYMNRGNSYLFRGRHEDAIVDYNNALKYSPHNFKIHVNLGRAQYHIGKFGESIENFSTAIEINPKLDIIYRDRGDAFRKNKMYSNAIKDYEHVLISSGYDWYCRYKIADCKYKLALMYKEKQDMGKYRNSLVILNETDLTIEDIDKATNGYKNKIKVLIDDIKKLSNKLSNQKG